MSRYDRRRNLFTALSVVALVIAWSAAIDASAVERTYTVDSSQSSVTVSGSMTASGVPIFGTVSANIQTQTPGNGLTTTYTGTIRADRGAGTIDFLPSLLAPITANNSGNWSPLNDNGDVGTAPANYGGRVSFVGGIVTATFAGRDFQADLSSGPLAITGTSFPISTVDWNFLNNSRVAYRPSSTVAPGHEDIGGRFIDLSGNGTLEVIGGTTEKLTVPIVGTLNLDLGGGSSATINFNGQIVATAMVPEPSTILSGIAGVAGLLCFARWQRYQRQRYRRQ
jgi:hypothetical protein